MTFLEFAIALTPKTKTEAVTDALALAGAMAPAWSDGLHSGLAILFQIFGIGWLGVQIFVKLHITYWKKK